MLRRFAIIGALFLCLGFAASCGNNDGFGSGGTNGLYVLDANGDGIQGATVWIPEQQNLTTKLAGPLDHLALTSAFGDECTDPLTAFTSASCTNQFGFAPGITCTDGTTLLTVAFGEVEIDSSTCDELIGGNTVNIPTFYVHPKVLTPNLNEATVSVIDSTTNAVVDTFDIDGAGFGLAMTPTGDQAYVSFASGFGVAQGQPGPSEGIDLLDVETGAIVDVIDLEGGLGTTLRVSPDGQWLAVGIIADFGPVAPLGPPPGFVAIIDTNANVIDPAMIYPLGSIPIDVLANPDSTLFFVSHIDFLGGATGVPVPAGIAVVDPELGVLDDIDFTSIGQPLTMKISPDGSTLYVLVASKGFILVAVDVATGDVNLDDFTIFPVEALGMDISPDGSTAYVAEFENNVLDIVDLTTFEITDTIPLNGVLAPFAVELSSDGKTAFILSSEISGLTAAPTLNQVVQVDLVNQTISDPVDVGSGIAFPTLTAKIGVQGKL